MRRATASATISPPGATTAEGAPPNLPWRRLGLPLLVTRVLGQGLEFAAFALLARALGPADFGRLSLAFLACRYAGLVGDWGASIRGVRDTADPHGGSTSQLIRRRSRMTTPLCVGYIAVVVLLGRPELTFLALVLAARGLNRDWLSLGLQRGACAGLPAVLQGAAMLLGTAVMASSLASAAAVVAVGYGMGLALSLVLNPRPTEPGGRQPGVDGWLLTAVLADQVTASSDTAMLAVLRSTREAGIYAAVYRIPNAWVTVIGLTVLALIPAMTRTLAYDPFRLRELRRRALGAGLLAGTAIVLTIPLAYLLAPVLFGQQFGAGRAPLVLLLLATAVVAVAAPLQPMYVALRRDRALSVVTMATAGFNVTANTLVIPSFGMVGAATTTLMAQIVLLTALWIGTGRRVGGAEW
jgi:O-antigen/teichoic acid export membrane protein